MRIPVANAPRPDELASEFLERQIVMLDKMGTLGGSTLDPMQAAYLSGMRSAVSIVKYCEEFQSQTERYAV